MTETAIPAGWDVRFASFLRGEFDLRLPRSPSLRSAHQRGFDSRLRGVSRYSCPYEERPGWSGAFYRAWQDGWEAADALALPAPHVNVDDVYPEEEA